jgi:hypothetical protein
MRRVFAMGILCAGLAACALPIEGPPPIGAASGGPAPALGHDLQSARLACNEAYPAHVGNYLRHARCVNAAVERYALPGARYPDLTRLQEQVRMQLSARIDNRAISAHEGETQMAEADRAITAAEHDRNAAHDVAANEQIARVQAMLSE